MLFLEKSSHPYFLPLAEQTILGLPHPFGKLLQAELGMLHAVFRFALCTAHVWRIVSLIIWIITCKRNLWLWGHIRNPYDICSQQFHRLQESCRLQTTGRTPRCTQRWSRWRSRAGRYWPIDWIVSWLSCRNSRCTWRWRPLYWELLRGKHVILALTTLGVVISLPQWPITWIVWAYAGGWLRMVVCHDEWRMVIPLRSAWNWLLWRRTTIPMGRMIMIGVFPRLTVFASGRVWNMIQGSRIVVTVLLQGK